MSTYTSLTANIDGLMSAVKLTWVQSLDGDATMVSQSIYYTDVYQSGDGGLIHDNKVLDLAATDLSATITGLTSDRVYDFTIVGKDSVGTDFDYDVSANPHQLAEVPEFTLEKGDAQFTVKVSNHKESTTKYILFINGNVGAYDKLRTITVAPGDVTNGTWTNEISEGIVNSTQVKKSFYEVSLRAVNTVSTSAMTGSQTVEATNALAQLTGLEVLTGPERPANISSKAIVKFNAVPGATKYYIKAFTADSKTLAEMITDADANAAANGNNNWFETTNLFYHMNNELSSEGAAELVAGNKYRFAVVPYGTGTSALSADSLAYVEATPSGKPVTIDNILVGTTGKDISGGDASVANDLTFAQMNGKYQVAWTTTKDQWEGIENGLPITALTFSLSGEDDEILKTKVVSGSDLSYTGFAMFEGLTNGNKYEVAVKTTNANGDSSLNAYTTSDEVVSTRPTNFTLIAGPAVGAQDISQNGDLDISYNMNGNGLGVNHTATSPNFVFDLSGMDDSIGGTDLCLNALNALATAVGNRYIIKARASNDNGDASPKELTAIVKPSKPPAVYHNDLSNATFAQSRIHIKETTAFNKIIANFSNMATVSNGYDVTGVRVRAVYHGSNDAWSGEWMIVNDLSRDVEINLPAITDPSNVSPHTTYKLNVEPFNAVYTKDYQILDATADANKPAGYPKVMKSGLQMHVTPSINVISSRLGITNLRMTSTPDVMDNKMKFTWRCDASGTDNLELLLAETGVNDANTGYKVPTWSDYKLLGLMSSTKYNADAEDPATTEMSFDLSNESAASDIAFSNSTDDKEMQHAKAYYFMVREEAHPGNEERAFGVSKGVPVVTDLSFSDYKSRDLITFTVDPNGAKLSSLFLLNNINPTGDYFFNVLESGAVPSSIYEKLESHVSGEIKVAIQKDQFERNKEQFPQNVLFHALAGNSAGVTLATNNGIYKDLTDTDHPYMAAAEALGWAIKAEALADEAEALAATINSQSAVNDNGRKNTAIPPMSPADTAAKLVREHAKFARGASDLVNAAAIINEVYEKAPNDKGNNKTAQEQYTEAVTDMNALRLLSA